MSPTFPILIENMRDPNKPLRIVGRDTNGHPRILAGKMRRPDTLHWSALGDGESVTVTGLWRGNPRYGAFECPVEALQNALSAGAFIADLSDLNAAVEAWQKNRTECAV